MNAESYQDLELSYEGNTVDGKPHGEGILKKKIPIAI
jgi:hypothetical protein